MRRVLATVILATLISSCTGRSQSTHPRPTMTLATTASPIAVPNGAKLAHPRSGSAEIGIPYPFSLYTHCGVDFHVDFDGSFWQLVDGSQRGQFDNPQDNGTMILLENGLARFQSFSGSSVEFVRYTFPKELKLCD